MCKSKDFRKPVCLTMTVIKKHCEGPQPDKAKLEQTHLSKAQ